MGQEMTEQGSPASEGIEHCARTYVAACVDVVNAMNAATEKADNARAARAAADRRPQHEISIRNFTAVAERQERAFVPLYEAFAAANTRAREAAKRLLEVCGSRDPDSVLLEVSGEEGWRQAGVVAHLLRATFGPSPSGFRRGVEAVNAAIEADTAEYGGDGHAG